MNTQPFRQSEHELFEWIRTHQALLRLEHRIETYLDEHPANPLLGMLLETIQSVLESLNRRILQHPFWRTD